MPQYLSPGVYVEEVDRGSKPIEGVGTAVAAFIGFAEKGVFNTPTLITNWTQFRDNFGEFMEGSFLAHAVYGYFNNGGGRCYVVRIGEAPEAKVAPLALKGRTEAVTSTLEIKALEPGEPIKIEIGDDSNPEDNFKMIFKRGPVEEVFDNLSMKKGKRYVETVINDTKTGSKLVRVKDKAAVGTLSERRPEIGVFSLSMPTAENLPAVIKADSFNGDPASRTGLGGMTAVDEVTMVCIPDLMSAYLDGRIDLVGVQAVQQAMMEHCERMRDRVAIIDCPPDMTPQEVQNWRVNVVKYDSKYAALYYPWVKVFDPILNQPVAVPPCGHMAGIWARNDTERGVHKAPANEVVRGAIDLGYTVNKEEQESLNPHGINCIRAFPGRGIRVWGARLLSSDPAWRYLNVRRLFNFVEKSVEIGTQWVVFEPNDMDLWERVKRTITAFLKRIWRDGALFGATAGEAFYVKCDAETNPPEVIDAGQLICEIGICPVKPAEFVIFRISQWQGGSAVSE
jgi:phage tail sheath protein FI